MATLVCCLLPLLWTAPGGAATSDSIADKPKVALVIGNGRYTSVPELRNPGNDAQDMCRELRGLGYQAYCYTDVATRAQFRSIVQDFGEKLSPNTLSLLFYAGHAVQIRGENYLVPTGARLENDTAVVAQSVSIGYVMNELQRSRAFLKILIIDACRDDPLEARNPTEIKQIEITALPDDAFILYGTAANDVSLDGQGQNGVLTKNLLAHLHDAGDLNDMFNTVSDGVRNDTTALGHPQSPEIRRNSTIRYCFFKCTYLEDLQMKQQAAAREIDDLRTRVAAGDNDAKSQLNAMLKIQADMKKKEAEAAKQAKEDVLKNSVPPSM